MINSVLHKANTRGGADMGWLNAKHSFSFSNYYDPKRMNFGVLRVLNDDIIGAGTGFGTHPHDNMEIITIPTEGDLAHKDSMGNGTTIKTGDIQVMSAGTGIQHSEQNPNHDKQTKLFQIWLFPNKQNVTPRYQQISLNVEDKKNNLLQIVSPNPDDAGVWIHQDAWFHLGKLDKDFSIDYDLKRKGNGIYAFVVSGDFSIENQQETQELSQRDALGMWETSKITIKATSENAEILLLEVPMQVN